MDFGSLLHAAQRNERNSKKEPVRCYRATFDPPKKEVRDSKALSANIQKFLARKEEEEKRREIEATKKRTELLALRSQDGKAKKRVAAMLKRTKAANKSAIDDAVDNDNTAVTLGGPAQPDEDDYGYVSQEASAFYAKLMDKYQAAPPEEPLFPQKSSKGVIKDLNSTKDRVRNALLKAEEEEMMPHKRKRKSKDKGGKHDDGDETLSYATSDRRDLGDDEVEESSDREEPSNRDEPSYREEPKRKHESKPHKPRRPAPPPLDFNELLKIAEQKQFEPVKKPEVIAKPKDEDEPDRPMTKKEKLEYQRELEARKRRQERDIARQKALNDRLRGAGNRPKATASDTDGERPYKNQNLRIPKINRDDSASDSSGRAGMGDEREIPRVSRTNESERKEERQRIPKNFESERREDRLKIPKLSHSERREDALRIPKLSEIERKDDRARMPKFSESERRDERPKIQKNLESERKDEISRIPKLSESEKRDDRSRIHKLSESERRDERPRIPKLSESERRDERPRIPKLSESERKDEKSAGTKMYENERREGILNGGYSKTGGTIDRMERKISHGSYHSAQSVVERHSSQTKLGKHSESYREEKELQNMKRDSFQKFDSSVVSQQKLSKSASSEALSTGRSLQKSADMKKNTDRSLEQSKYFASHPNVSTKSNAIEEKRSISTVKNSGALSGKKLHENNEVKLQAKKGTTHDTDKPRRPDNHKNYLDDLFGDADIPVRSVGNNASKMPKFQRTSSDLEGRNGEQKTVSKPTLSQKPGISPAGSKMQSKSSGVARPISKEQLAAFKERKLNNAIKDNHPSHQPGNRSSEGPHQNNKIKPGQQSDIRCRQLPPSDKSKKLPTSEVKPKQFPPPDVRGPKQFPSSDVRGSKQFPPDVRGPKQFPPPDVRGPKQFPPPDVRGPKKFPPPDIRKKPKPAPVKRRIDSDEDEYDSELDDFIDDGPDDAEDYSKHIKEIFGYDKSRYLDMDDDDDECMEANFAQVLKEEFVSTKIGIMEDLEDIQKEQEEKRRKAMLKKRKLR